MLLILTEMVIACNENQENVCEFEAFDTLRSYYCLKINYVIGLRPNAA